MNYDAVVAAALDCIPTVREFGELFPNGEHTLVKAKRSFDRDGWQIAYEWISTSHLHDRYVVWLVVAIEIGTDDSLTELEKPCVYLVEVNRFKNDDPEGPGWELSMAEFEDGDWEQLVASGGDFAAIGLELRTDAPVEGFAEWLRKTRPTPLAEPPLEGMAFKAPLRFMMQ